MTFQRFFQLSFVCLLLSIPRSALGQLSVYLGPALTGFATGTGSNLQFKNDAGGFIAGGFYDFHNQGRLKAGVDLRTVLSPGTMGGDFTGLAVRIAFVPHKFVLRPYFQLGGGVVTTTVNNYIVYNGNTVTVAAKQRFTNGGVEIDFGLDVRLSDHFDLRIPDYGAAAGGSSSTNAAMAFLGVGVVYHLHPESK